MSRWGNEFPILRRFLSVGAINTVFGVGAIFVFMQLGMSSIAANIAGFACGIAFSFFTSRRYIFRSQGSVAADLVRYLGAFSVAFVCNLAVLYATVNWLKLNATLGQISAVCSYVVALYLLNRFFVFRARL
jgi:putative flippase GtrA